MKKLLALALAMLMLTGAVNAPAAEAGETVTVEFSILEDSGEIYVARLELQYDHEALELVPNRFFVRDVNYILIYGTSLQAVFHIKENAAPREYPVTLKILEASDPMGEAVLSPETALVFSEEYVTVERPPAEVPVYYYDAATGELMETETVSLPVGWTGTVTGNAPEGYVITGGQSMQVTISEDGQAMPPVVTFWLTVPTSAPTATPTPTPTPTATPTSTPTATPTPTPTPTATPTPAPTPTPAAPLPITDLRVTAKESTSVTLDWNGMENAGPYKVAYRKSGTDEWTYYENIVYGAKAEVRGLEKETVYDFRVTSLSELFYGQGAVLSRQKTAAETFVGETEKFTGGDYEYTLTDNGDAVITGYNGNGGEVTIPANIDGHPVIYIGDMAFSACGSLTSVTIPGSVTGIGVGAFLYCNGLTSVTIPDSITRISDSAFFSCNELTSVTIPDGVTIIDKNTFNNCIGLTSIKIPDSVTIIDEFAFYNCIGLTSITIPDSVKTIGSWAFADCDSLTAVTIPAGVTIIGDDAFLQCDRLSSVTIPNSVTEIGDNPWANCPALKTINISSDHPSLSMIDGALYSEADKRLIWVPKDRNGSFNIRQGTRIIGGEAFRVCRGVTSVTIPDSVMYIGRDAFGFSGLTSVTIPDSVIYIDKSAFLSCDFLTSVTIPGSVKYIGDEAFGSIDDLVSVTFGNGTVELGNNPWKYSGSLKTFIVSPDHPTLFVSDGALYSKPDKRLVRVPGKMQGDLVIPQGVVTIGKGAAYGCDLLTSITIPESVVSIEEGAFYQCAGLTSVTIPDSVTSIGTWAFSDCAGLTSVTIPAGVTDIGYGAFENCPNLVLTVTRGSYAEEYCVSDGLPYRYAEGS